MNQSLAAARLASGRVRVAARLRPVKSSSAPTSTSTLSASPSPSPSLRTPVPQVSGGGQQTALIELVRQGQLGSQNRLPLGAEAPLRLQTKGSTGLSQSVFAASTVNTFEGNNKQVWMDLKSGWCHLCQEPIGGSMGIHIGDRDHICLQLFLHLYAAYPRQWKTSAMFRGAASAFPSLHEYATFCRGDETEHLHVHEDARRRAELEALLFRLTEPPHHALSHSLQGKSPMSFWYSGERMWKINLTRLCTQMFPPMSAGVMTTFTHKCWGRSNLERMYDALNIARIVKHYGAEPKTTKDHKAYFMRLVFWELQSAEYRPHEEVDETTRFLIQTTKRRMCFEMIFLQSMQYMNRVQDVQAKLGYPTTEDLMAWNLL